MFLLAILLPPFWAIPLILLYQKNKIGKYNLSFVLLIWFLISLVGVYWFPWGDSQTHFSIYYSDIVNIYYEKTLLSPHWFYDYIIKLIADVFGNYTFGYFFWVFMPFSVFLYCIFRTNKIDGTNFIILIYLILSLGIREVLDLNRNTAAALLFLSALFLFKDRKIQALALILCAFLLHSTTKILLLSLPLGLIFYKFSVKKINLIALFIPLISILLIVSLGHLFLSQRDYNLYVADGGLSYSGVNSGFMRLLTYVNIGIFVVNFLLINRNKSVIPKNYFIIHLSLGLLTCFVFAHWVGRERFMLVYNLYAAALLVLYGHNFTPLRYLGMKRIYNYYIKLFVLKILLILSLTYSGHIIHNSSSINNEIEYSIVARPFYLPAAMLLDIDSFGFSDKQFNTLYRRVQDTNE